MAGLFRDKYIHVKGSNGGKTDLKTRISERFGSIKDDWKKEKREEKQILVCPDCKGELDRDDVVVNNYICTACGSYFRIRTKNRIRMVCDKDTFQPWFEEMEISNPLDFPGYEEKLLRDRKSTRLNSSHMA